MVFGTLPSWEDRDNRGSPFRPTGGYTYGIWCITFMGRPRQLWVSLQTNRWVNVWYLVYYLHGKTNTIVGLPSDQQPSWEDRDNWGTLVDGHNSRQCRDSDTDIVVPLTCTSQSQVFPVIAVIILSISINLTY